MMPIAMLVETVGNPAYPLELFQRIITVSLETMKIVKNLPKLELRETEQIWHTHIMGMINS